MRFEKKEQLELRMLHVLKTFTKELLIFMAH